MSKRSIENAEVSAEIEFVAENAQENVQEKIEKKAEKTFLKIAFRNTKLKQLFVEGSANLEFVVLDKLNNREVGKGKTNADGKAICICEYLNDKIKVIKK